jgi:hypothetical protein
MRIPPLKIDVIVPSRGRNVVSKEDINSPDKVK